MSDKHTWRELLYLGEYEGAHLFAAESESARLNGRGGLGHLVRYYRHQDFWRAECSCQAFDHFRPDSCWHVREAPLAYSYWLIRDGLSSRAVAEFDRLHAAWWPRRADVTTLARDGNYLGKSAEEWELFYTALLDEYEARGAAVMKAGWAFGKKVVEELLYDESA